LLLSSSSFVNVIKTGIVFLLYQEFEDKKHRAQGNENLQRHLISSASIPGTQQAAMAAAAAAASSSSLPSPSSSSSSFPSSSSLPRAERFYVELKDGETTFVSWRKLQKESSRLRHGSSASSLPPPLGAHPALEARFAPSEVDNPPKKPNLLVHFLKVSASFFFAFCC
jgi:hypothetical protein